MKFGMFGCGAYVAPRHMKAISETGNELVVAVDPYDNVGILDSYAPGCQFFTVPERFDRHVSKLCRRGEGPEWFSVCTPNWLHDSHCMTAMRYGANVVCEKPLVLSPWNLDELQEEELRTGKRVFTVMQLRHHPALIKARDRLDSFGDTLVDLTYITGRGPWFKRSWKWDPNLSGGIIFNIGIHFLDALMWMFGDAIAGEVYWRDDERISGRLHIGMADVRWYLSINAADIPPGGNGARTYRQLSIDGKDIEFSGGFEDLHTTVYRETLAGRGLGINDARPAIELAHKINALPITGGYIDMIHPLLRRFLREAVADA